VPRELPITPLVDIPLTDALYVALHHRPEIDEAARRVRAAQVRLDLACHAARAEDQSFNVTLERTLDREVGELDVYPADLRRVFLNLIGNAFYAVRMRAAEGGDGKYSPTVSVSTRRSGDSVEVRIRDNGTGVAQSLKDRIFDPFFTTKPPGEGTGLGLSLSYETVVEQHKGWMAVSSEEGVFTEFLVTLPL